MIIYSALLILCTLCCQGHGFTPPIPRRFTAARIPYQSLTSSHKKTQGRAHNSVILSEAAASSSQEATAAPESETLDSILSADIKNDAFTLYSLSDLRSYRSWDFSWPTITKPHRFTPRHTYASDRAFFAAIQAHNSGLSLDLLTAVGAFDEVNSVVLYGGALVDVITKREDSIHDWDFRLVGKDYVESPEKCVEAAHQFVRNVFAYLKRENDNIQIANQGRTKYEEESLFDIQQVKVMRAHSTVTVVVPGRGYRVEETILQLTFSPFATVEDLFGTIFPHCTRVAIKDNAVVLDAAAKYCLESLCVVIDTGVVNSATVVDEEKQTVQDLIHSEVTRSIKYFETKGFDIILPKLDMEKVPKRNLEFGQREVLDLPEMTIVVEGCEDNKIMANSIGLVKQGNGAKTNNKLGYNKETKFDAAKFIHHNIRCLVAGVYDGFYFWAEGEAFDHVFDYVPLITGRMVDKAYETVKKNALSSGTVNINKVQSYFSATPPPEVLRQVLMDGLTEVTEKADSGTYPEPFSFDDDVIAKLISKEKNALEKKLSNIRGVMKEKGLVNNMIVEYERNDVSSNDEILRAVYGDYLLE